MNPERRTAFFKGSPMNLTRKEYDMFRLLAENPGRVFTYEQIFGQVWNEEYVGSANTISKHVSRLHLLKAFSFCVFENRSKKPSQIQNLN